MNNRKQFWITVALVNLGIVALLGFTLRSKILFPLEGIDFKNILHAHSHYAFGGWITLAITTLMVHELLPVQTAAKKYYQWILGGLLVTAAGMLVAFICQGYAFFSILFSTLFIFVTYAFCFLYIRDALKAKMQRAALILSICSVIYLAISSVGPFMLAYLIASHSSNNLLYRDSIYTYLHLQYNGFFALGVFALFVNQLKDRLSGGQLQKVAWFAIVLSFSVAPSLFISYLWHYTDISFRGIALLGCGSVLAAVVCLVVMVRSLKEYIRGLHPFVRKTGRLAFVAFILKSLLQTGTVIPWLGKLVFGDRAIIIGYLHLVLLGFISLYLLTHMLHTGLLDKSLRFTRWAVRVFTGAIIANESILAIQGFGNMLMFSNSMYTWLLWGISIWLLTGVVMIISARVKFIRNSHIADPGRGAVSNSAFHITN